MVTALLAAILVALLQIDGEESCADFSEVVTRSELRPLAVSDVHDVAPLVVELLALEHDPRPQAVGYEDRKITKRWVRSG